MSLITVIYWRSSGVKCRHQECLTSLSSQQTVQGSSSSGVDSCAKVSYSAAFQAIAHPWCLPCTTAAMKEGRNKDNPSGRGEETDFQENILSSPLCFQTHGVPPQRRTSPQPSCWGALHSQGLSCTHVHTSAFAYHGCCPQNISSFPATLHNCLLRPFPPPISYLHVWDSAFLSNPLPTSPLFLSSYSFLCKSWGLSSPAWGDLLWPASRKTGDSLAWDNLQPPWPWNHSVPLQEYLCSPSTGCWEW